MTFPYGRMSAAKTIISVSLKKIIIWNVQPEPIQYLPLELYLQIDMIVYMLWYACYGNDRKHTV